MREILFKAKTCNGKWVEGLLSTKDNKWFISNKAGMPFAFEIRPETISQYTGLNDKNDNKIWENDIVKYQFDNDDCPFLNKRTEKIIGRIFFSDFRASFSVTAGRKGSPSMNNDLFRYVRNGNRVEVIGNIFDNPELLEGGAE